MQAIQNLGLALCTMFSGLIVDKFGYIWLEMFFIFWLVVALLCTIAIWLIDFSTTRYLNMGVAERDDYDALQAAMAEAQAAAAAQIEDDSYVTEGLRPRTHSEIRNR